MTTPKRDDFAPAPALPLGRYRHYKGGEYNIVCLACDEATHEWLVIYSSLENHAGIPTTWVRTYSNFVSEVDRDGETVARFTYIGS